MIANAQALIAAAGENLNMATASLQAAAPGEILVSDSIELIKAQTGLAVACIDLARLL